MTPANVLRLQHVYRREYRSLLQYVREASPYAALADRPVRDGVMRIAKEEATAIEAFGEWLEEHRLSLPYLGSFPVGFTDLNFVGIRHLLPKLIAEQKRDLQVLEADVSSFADVVARAAVQRLVDVHQRHLKELESLG